MKLATNGQMCVTSTQYIHEKKEEDTWQMQYRWKGSKNQFEWNKKARKEKTNGEQRNYTNVHFFLCVKTSPVDLTTAH